MRNVIALTLVFVGLILINVGVADGNRKNVYIEMKGIISEIRELISPPGGDKKSGMHTVITHPSPKHLLRFTDEDGSFVASFQTNLMGDKINHPQANEILTDTFSYLTKKNVSGAIWENKREDIRTILFHVYNEKEYIGMVIVNRDIFLEGGKFVFNLEALKIGLDDSLNQEVKILGIREKFDNSRQDCQFQNGWITLASHSK